MPKKKARKEKPASKAATKAESKDIPAIVKADVVSNLLLPASELSKKHYPVEMMIDGFMWVVHDFLSQQECKAWIDFVEQSKKLEYVQHPATKYIAQRECFRWQQNNETIAQTLFQRMLGCGILQVLQDKVDFPSSASTSSSSSSYVPTACNPNIRLYKYEKGMSFGKHVDENNSVEGIGQTEVTVLVYLSDCQGGATRFYPHTSGKRRNNSIAFVPKLGAMLIHVHGDRCLEHEADPVLQGVKYILRTDIVYGHVIS